MNMFLHNIGEIDGDSPVSPNDALIAPPKQTFDYVLANPPFGKKSSMTFTNEEGEQDKDDLTYNRQDFWATTSNKQLNFVQHIRSLLKTTGRRRRGGAGQRAVRGRRGRNGAPESCWKRPTCTPSCACRRAFFTPTASRPTCCSSTTTGPQGSLDAGSVGLRLPHQRSSHAEKEAAALRGFAGFRRLLQPAEPLRAPRNLDIFWLKDKSLADLDNLPEPDDLAGEIIENLEAGLNSFRAVSAALQ
jgi:type I restriction enzyme M protein